MKLVVQVLIYMLLTNKNFINGEQELQNASSTTGTITKNQEIEISVATEIAGTNSELTSEAALKISLLKEILSTDLNLVNNDLAKVVSENITRPTNKQEAIENSLKPYFRSDKSVNLDLVQNELAKTDLRQAEIKNDANVSYESSIKEHSTYEKTSNPLNVFGITEKSNSLESFNYMQQDKIDKLDNVAEEALNIATYTISTNNVISLGEFRNWNLILNNSWHLFNKQEDNTDPVSNTTNMSVVENTSILEESELVANHVNNNKQEDGDLENSSKYFKSLNEYKLATNSLNNPMVFRNTNWTDGELVNVINLNKKENGKEFSTNESLLEIATVPFSISKTNSTFNIQNQNSSDMSKKFMTILLKEETIAINKLEENDLSSREILPKAALSTAIWEKSTTIPTTSEPSISSTTKPSTSKHFTSTPTNNYKKFQKSAMEDNELHEIVRIEPTSLSVEQREKMSNSKESFVEVTTSSAAENKLISKLFRNLEDSTNSEKTGRHSTDVNKQQVEITTHFGYQLEDIKEHITKSDKTTSKPLLSLEEYAVKQMNFILDYLLLETQEFVAKVLQATINSVFPRDHLKRYAEGVNRVLNYESENDYSDEVVESIKTSTEDEIYEEIMQKLHFLKNKPSKYLQSQMPQEWLKEFQDKRVELSIWLDKATEQMHKEFNYYITEEEDPIKCQYFNETFDDISRATEIHHKLALLADLVKIVKNKKQITFMDLYMQT